MLKATCHCGAVTIEVNDLPERLISCNCSICRRYSALWGHLTRATAKVSYGPGAASAYLCNDHVIEFYHCNNCGCVTHYESVNTGLDERLSINFRMFDHKDIEALEVRYFDGAVSWKMLE
jgi:hypothetical protein